MTACTTHTHHYAHDEKIKTINLYQLNENVFISSSDPKKINGFKAVQIKTNDFSSNTVLKNALVKM